MRYLYLAIILAAFLALWGRFGSPLGDALTLVLAGVAVYAVLRAGRR